MPFEQESRQESDRYKNGDIEQFLLKMLRVIITPEQIQINDIDFIRLPTQHRQIEKRHDIRDQRPRPSVTFEKSLCLRVFVFS